MKVGLMLDLRNPQPWSQPWSQHYGRTLELAQWSDGLGIGGFWLTEHHFFGDGYLSQPLVLAAAIAARTATARIGTAVLLGPIRHPLHIAEEAALVDLISGGRLELGLGAGYVEAEFDAFGVDVRTRLARTDEVVREVQRHFAGGRIDPPPVQRPVPIWLGYLGPRNARRAGRLGVGLLSLRRQSFEPYLEGLAEAGHDASIARMGGVVDIVVADDPEAAWPRILPHYVHQLNTYQRAHGGAPAPGAMLTAEDLRDPRAALELPGLAVRLRVMTYEDAIVALKACTNGLPVHHVYLWASIAGMPADLVERNIELVATRVAPALA